MSEIPTSWQDEAIAKKYLEERCAALPFGSEMLAVAGQILDHFATKVETILDLGAGDGFFTLAVLDKFPTAKVILIDHSQPMLERARAKMAALDDRVTFIEADLGHDLAEFVENQSVDLVLSRFVIHHFPHDRKQTIYGEIFSVLRPGGCFLHNEHVASATKQLETLSDSLVIDAIAARTGRDRSAVSDEFYGRADRLDNKLLDVQIQLDWLKQWGFEQVDCYFKWLELAVFGGRKPL